MSTPYQLQNDLTEEQLQAWLALPEIAVDTELHGLRLGRDQVLLVQVGDHLGNVALVRTEQLVEGAADHVGAGLRFDQPLFL